MKPPDAGLEEALARFLDPRGRTDIRFGLERISAALKVLGNPQDNIPPAIHIAGTNGKGSVAAFLRHMAEACDLGVHVFTSPHLIRVNERIRLCGRLVENHELTQALERVHGAGEDLTYFEALTAAGFLLFSKTAADLSVIEVGAGGALDSTNVMTAPGVCVITSIGRDHEAMFGTTDILEIARTKAGIMRRDVPVVIAEQTPNVRDVLLEAAGKAGAPVLLAGEDWTTHWDAGAFVYEDAHGMVRAPWLGLAGAHQRINAGAACAALRALALKSVTSEAMSQGLRETVWPARMQELAAGPVTSTLKARVIVDGAHNPPAARKLADAMQATMQAVEQPAHSSKKSAGSNKPAVLIAMQANKDARQIIEAIAPQADFVVACSLPSSGGQEGGKGAEPEVLAELAEEAGAHAMVAETLDDALHLLAAAGFAQVYVCGSLYLAGEIIARNGETVD